MLHYGDNILGNRINKFHSVNSDATKRLIPITLVKLYCECVPTVVSNNTVALCAMGSNNFSVAIFQ